MIENRSITENPMNDEFDAEGHFTSIADTSNTNPKATPVTAVHFKMKPRIKANRYLKSFYDINT